MLSYLFNKQYSKFFFYSHCDHRDLHSFPTRRSSDLHVFADPRLLPDGDRRRERRRLASCGPCSDASFRARMVSAPARSEEHTSELQSQSNLVCRLLLEKKNEFHQCRLAATRLIP